MKWDVFSIFETFYRGCVRKRKKKFYINKFFGHLYLITFNTYKLCKKFFLTKNYYFHFLAYIILSHCTPINQKNLRFNKF